MVMVMIMVMVMVMVILMASKDKGSGKRKDTGYGKVTVGLRVTSNIAISAMEGSSVPATNTLDSKT